MRNFKYAKLDKSKPSSRQPSIEDEQSIKPVQMVRLTELSNKDLIYFEKLRNEMVEIERVVEIDKVATVQKYTTLRESVRRFEPININTYGKLVTFPHSIADDLLSKLKVDKVAKRLIAKLENGLNR